MKITLMVRLVFIVILIVALSNETAIANTEKNKEDIRLAVEKSTLSQEQKAILLSRSYAAIKAGIPSDDISIIINRGLAKGWDSKSLESLMTNVINSKEQNLPVKPVLNRIEQGLSKGVSPEKVLYAAEGLIVKLEAANRIVNNLVRSGMKTDKDSDTGDAVQSVARAMEKLIPETTITDMGTKISRNKQSITKFNAYVNTMTTCVEMGMPMERALKIVHRAIDKDYTEGDIIMMEKSFFNEIKSGSDMNHIMQNLESTMNRGGMGFSGMGGGSGGGGGRHGGR